MTLLRTSFLSLIATLFKISYGLVINKLIAIYVGPTGIALFGQFQSLQAGLNGLATAGFRQGLIKYLSEFKDDVKRSKRVFASAVKLNCLMLLPISVVLFLFADILSKSILGDIQYAFLMQILSVSLVPASLGGLFMAALNGLREVKKLTAVGILSSLLGITLAFALIPTWGVSGAIIVLLLTPFLVLVASLTLLKKSKGFSWCWFKDQINKEDCRRLGKFTIMAVASAVSIPVSHILIRNYLSEHISLEAAGLWTGMWRISEAYLMVITMTLSVYYLPKLSQLQDVASIKKEIRQGQILILPCVVISALLMYLLRDWIVFILFDEQFAAMKELFAFQLVGDVIKIATFLYAYMMIAKAKALVFLVTEIFFSFLFVVLTILFVDSYGLVGVSYSFTVNYVIALVFFYVWFQCSCKKNAFN